MTYSKFIMEACVNTPTSYKTTHSYLYLQLIWLSLWTSTAFLYLHNLIWLSSITQLHKLIQREGGLKFWFVDIGVANYYMLAEMKAEESVGTQSCR